ncbi:EamA family transporter [Rhizobium nepotum]|uniref:EamA domain-containing protein n=1 Tax=Rhizobium nepotum 39/7 TaxID=1368418 RepID=A0ABR5CL44_9HYPH|nr:EamA family transporter [Rhizobium nepotum]KJF65455.1 hypothetical protein RS75_23135 [Rhizobium nepotum 39/7]
MHSNRVLFPAASIIAALVSSSIGATVAKSTFPIIGAEGMTALRVGFSAMILWLITRPWRTRTSMMMGAKLTAYGVALALMNIMIFQAFARLPIGIATAIEVLGPISVALAGSRRKLDFLWVLLAIFGLIILLPLRQESTLDPIGLLLAAGAAFCWGIYIVLGQKVAPIGAGRAVSLGMMVAALIAVPFGLFNSSPSNYSWAIIGLGLVVAVISSTIPYLLEMMAFGRLPQKLVGLLLSGAPAIAAAVAAILLGETLTPTQWIAVTLIIAASAGCALSSAPVKAYADPV